MTHWNVYEVGPEPQTFMNIIFMMSMGGAGDGQTRYTEGSKGYGLVRRNLASVFGGLAKEVEINLAKPPKNSK